MACQMCNGFEHFSQDPPKKKSCVKDSTNCMYTAQGMFVCNTPKEQEAAAKDRDVAQNLEMMKESFRNANSFYSAAQWQ